MTAVTDGTSLAFVPSWISARAASRRRASVRAASAVGGTVSKAAGRGPGQFRSRPHCTGIGWPAFLKLKIRCSDLRIATATQWPRASWICSRASEAAGKRIWRAKEARQSVINWIEMLCNPKRNHVRGWMLSLVDFER